MTYQIDIHTTLDTYPFRNSHTVGISNAQNDKGQVQVGRIRNVELSADGSAFVEPTAFDFIGRAGKNDLHVMEDGDGNLQFYAFTMADYLGDPNVAIVADEKQRLIAGSDAILSESDHDMVIVEVPTTSDAYYLFTVASGNLLVSQIDDVNGVKSVHATNVSGDLGNATGTEVFTGNLAAIRDKSNDQVILYALRYTPPAIYDWVKFVIDSPIADFTSISLTGAVTNFQGAGGQGGEVMDIAVSPNANELAAIYFDGIYSGSTGMFGTKKDLKLQTLALDDNFNITGAPAITDANVITYGDASLTYRAGGDELLFGADELHNSAIYALDKSSGSIKTLLQGYSGGIVNGNTNLAYMSAQNTDAIYQIDASDNALLALNTTLPTDPFKNILTGGISYAQNVVEAELGVVAKTTKGDRKYELKDHLGNVRVVISDAHYAAADAQNNPDRSADVVAYNNYYPFGMLQPMRHYTDIADYYRYGFNGMEQDGELKGKGNSYDFEARSYDPRIGRWWSVDPLKNQAPELTPFRYGFNNPIRYLDVDGKWESDAHYYLIYAIALQVGIKPENARMLGSLAERPDHIVHKDGSMTINVPEGKDLAFGLGFGTWAFQGYQAEYHGLDGGPRQVQIDRATDLIVNHGLFIYFHLLGDAFSHSYQNENGEWMMFGEHKHVSSKLTGTITFSHAFVDEHNHRREGPDPTDVIAERADVFMPMVTVIDAVFKNPNFEFSSEAINELNQDLWNYFQKTASSDDKENTRILQGYIEIMIGKTNEIKFNLKDEQNMVERMSGFLDKAGFEYEYKIENKGRNGKFGVITIQNGQ